MRGITLESLNDILGGFSCLPCDYHCFSGSDVLYRYHISDSLKILQIYPLLPNMVNVDRCINLIELIELEIDQLS